MLPANFDGRKKLRQKLAQERKEVTDNRTPQEQLARLDAKFGKDNGASKERSRLKKKIENANKVLEKEDLS